MTTNNLVFSVDNDDLNQFLANLKTELEDHRASINENTDEINQNFAYLQSLNQKIDKLTQRVDEICLFLKSSNAKFSDEKEYKITPLTKKEKAVFSTMYAFLAEGKDVTYRALAVDLCLPETLISGYVTTLIEKGIPINKKRHNKAVHLSLDRCFVEKQAKENIVGVNTLLTHWIQ